MRNKEVDTLKKVCLSMGRACAGGNWGMILFLMHLRSVEVRDGSDAALSSQTVRMGI